MTDHSKTNGPGQDEAADSGDDLDLDLAFDLEALAEEPPPVSAPREEAPGEPEVMVFSRGSVIDPPAPSAPSAPAFEPPEVPAPEELEPATEEDVEGIFDVSAPASEGHGEGGGELPPRPEEAAEEVLPPVAKAIPAAFTNPPEFIEPLPPLRGGKPKDGTRLGRAFGASLPPTKLPPRRSEAPKTEPLQEGAPTPGPEVFRKEIAPRAKEPAPPPPSEVPPSLADEPVSDLWGGRDRSDTIPSGRGNRRKTGSALAAKFKSLPWRWLVTGAAACGLVAAVMVLLPDGEGEKIDGPEGVKGAPPLAATPPKKGSDPLPAVTPPLMLDQSTAMEAITASTPEARILAQYTELAKESARRYFAAATVEEMLAVVRDPERVEPLMREFYSRNPLKPRELLDLTLPAGDDAVLGSKVFWRAKIDVKDEGRDYLVFEQLKSGARKAFLIDWEIAAKYNPMRWDAFAAECPTEPLDMRVFATLTPKYRPPFDDESKYAAFLLTHTDGASEILGYAERGSDVARRLLAIAADDFESRVYLRIRFAPDSKECVEILDMIESTDWIVVE